MHRAADAHGFSVETGVAGLPAALRASAGAGPLHIVVCAEYDALPGVGHGCGHNIICTASLGAAIRAAAIADAIGLTVTVLGPPGEELFGLRELPPGASGPGRLSCWSQARSTGCMRR